jgi:hypothetical protein
MSTGVDKLLRKLFADKEIVFLAHNAKFEYMVLYKHFGIYVKNFKDTFLASKLITAGLEVPKGYNGFQFSTASIWCRSFKSSQTSFTGEMTPEQLLYADTDAISRKTA